MLHNSSINPAFHLAFKLVCIALMLFVAACSSSGKSNSNDFRETMDDTYRSENPWRKGSFAAPGVYADKCERPRQSVDPLTGQPYPDTKGTLMDELFFMRSTMNEAYLWVDELVDLNPYLYKDKEAYFEDLLVPHDIFSYISPYSEAVDFFINGSSEDYGVSWAVDDGPLINYPITVSFVQSASPNQGIISRGDRVVAIDGIQYSNLNETNVSEFIDLLFADMEKDSADFSLIKSSGEWVTVTLQKSQIAFESVPIYSVFPTGESNVGYLLFQAHVKAAQDPLIEAVNYFKDSEVDEVILDLRYNGGGALSIASQLGYMLAGEERTRGELFERIRHNEKLQAEIDQLVADGEIDDPSIPFITKRLDDNAQPTEEDLPTLNLDRLVVITTEETCSASESIINSLKGLGVEIIQIGSTTCGKPYGSHVFDNCGTAYSIISFVGENSQGFGGFADGFSINNNATQNPAQNPGCSVKDDFTASLGDTDEAMLSSALYFLNNDRCQLNLSTFTPPTFNDEILKAKVYSRKPRGSFLQ